ncbi:hypothetical protein FGIG_04197 [Fasciola gigantica]|uniref:Uncharacterized protein n=1 Tax=Fasciola gigantica TaxID=46835 RepID=A0A504Z5J5_FASGI|nr:hypothetical protein FGIG_04197 [Fasciola gigantica]
MELKQRLTRWQNRMRNFRWGRRNKQLLTGPLTDAEVDVSGTRSQDNGRGLLAKKSRKSTEASTDQRNTDVGGLKYPIRWIHPSANSERLVDSDGIASLSMLPDTTENGSSPSVLNANGPKPPRYAKLTSITSGDLSNQPKSIGQYHKKKRIPERWNELTKAWRGSKRLRVSNTTRLKSSGDAVLHEEEEEYRRDELHTYAFDNAALDLQNPIPESSEQL